MTGIVPTNTYPCKDGKHVIIGGNGDSIYVRLMDAIGRSDLVRRRNYPIDCIFFFNLVEYRQVRNTRSIQIELKNKRTLTEPLVELQL